MGNLDLQHQPISNADLDLLPRLHRGDTAAFGELYRQTVAPLTRYVADRLPDPDRGTARDLVHDAFCDALADPALLRSDLLESMLHLAAQAVHRHDTAQRRFASTTPSIFHSRASQDTSPSRPIETGGHERLNDALTRLTELQRWVIQLRYLDGCPPEHTAQTMGRSVVAVRSLERRALRRLQVACTV